MKLKDNIYLERRKSSVYKQDNEEELEVIKIKKIKTNQFLQNNNMNNPNNNG